MNEIKKYPCIFHWIRGYNYSQFNMHRVIPVHNDMIIHLSKQQDLFSCQYTENQAPCAFKFLPKNRIAHYTHNCVYSIQLRFNTTGQDLLVGLLILLTKILIPNKVFPLQTGCFKSQSLYEEKQFVFKGREERHLERRIRKGEQLGTSFCLSVLHCRCSFVLGISINSTLRQLNLMEVCSNPSKNTAS